MTGGKLDTAGLAVLADERVAKLQHVVNTQREAIALLEHALKFYVHAPDGDIARQALAKLAERREAYGRAA